MHGDVFLMYAQIVKEVKSSYCLNTIFQKLHFSKSHFSETPQEKYDHVIILQAMSPKKCHKNFENRFTNKIIMPKNHFECAFCMCKGGNPNTLKLKIKQIYRIILRVWYSAMHTLQFCFGLVHFRSKIINLDFFLGK